MDEPAVAEWQAVVSWCLFPGEMDLIQRGSPGTSAFLVFSIQQHWNVYWSNLCRSFPNYKYSVFKHVFSKESWIDMKLHMSGIISESFINRPRLGRVHLRLQSVVLGWAPKLPDSWTIMCSFRTTLTYLFYGSPLPLSCSYPFCKLACVLQEQRFNSCRDIFCLVPLLYIYAGNEGTSLIFPLLILLPLLF